MEMDPRAEYNQDLYRRWRDARADCSNIQYLEDYTWICMGYFYWRRSNEAGNTRLRHLWTRISLCVY